MPGEYYLPTKESDTNSYTRDEQFIFLDLINLIAPEIPNDLTRRLASLGKNDTELVRHSIRDWSSKWNLLDDWAISDGINIFGWGGPSAHSAWITDPYELEYTQTKAEGETPRPSANEIPREIPSGSFTLTHDGLNLQSHTLGELRESITAMFNRQLDEYIDAIKKQAENKGWQSWSSKNRRDRSKNSEENGSMAHYIWTLRFQCFGQTHEEIANSVGVKKASVAEAVTKTMKGMCLTSRTQGRRGRPSRTTT